MFDLSSARFAFLDLETTGLSPWFGDRVCEVGIVVTEGKIRLDSHYNSGAAFTSYYVHVGRKRFGFTEEMGHIFKEGEKYRVYYVKASAYELIMSYERL